MGNRAVIRTKNEDGLALYLHWAGSPEDVEALLAKCESEGYRTPDSDPSYGWAWMVKEACDMFGDHGLSVGIDKFSNLGDQGDNGIYVIEGWKIVEHINGE